METELHPQEIKLMKALPKNGERISTDNIRIFDSVTAERVAYWLSQKELVKIDEETKTLLKLTDEGRIVLENGFIEKSLLKNIPESGRIDLETLISKGIIKKNQVNIALAWLKKRGWAIFEKGERGLIITATEKGLAESESELAEEKLMKKLSESEIYLEDIPHNEKKYVDILKKRNILKTEKIKKRYISLTEKGIEILPKLTQSADTINVLTSDLIRTGEWKKRKFRHYKVDDRVEPIKIAKKHPLRQMAEKIRKIFLEMGFTEARGPLVESSFWCFDALYQPQDHPARDLADTFYMKRPKKASLPEKYIQAVREAHERGVDGSTGWGYKWCSEFAAKPVLRTHTTAVSARYLAKIKPPAKIFLIDRAFRNEAIDYKHLMEFHQVEGIVVDESVSFTDLLGMLEEFYNKLGFDRVRFRPAYFPYTEMSVEPEVWMESKKQWVELGGSGIFRPEVTKPLGINCPVLAWGLSLERPVMLLMGIDDIRTLYKNNIKWLQDSEVII